MQTQSKQRARFGSCLLFLALALAGCSHKSDDAAGGVPTGNSPAQVQQSAQQQAAQRAAYYSSHPSGKGTGQNPAAASAFRGHP